MLTDVLGSQSVQRLQGILKNRYGLGLRINFIAEATAECGMARSPSLHGGDLRIPIGYGELYLATAIVPQATHLSSKDQTDVATLIQMILEPMMYNWYLKREEGNKMTFDPIYFNRFEHEELLDTNIEIEEKRRDGLSSAVFALETENPILIPKVALQIHEITKRWAFSRFEDMRMTINSVEELRLLGSMTLLIMDLMSLTLDTQFLIAEYLDSANLDEEPLILIGLCRPLESLIKDQLVHPALAQYLAGFRLNLERLPTQSAQMREALELILDRNSVLN